jgi:hypothetical protein
MYCTIFSFRLGKMALLRKSIGLYNALLTAVSAASLTLMGQTVRLGNTTFYIPGSPTSILNAAQDLQVVACRSTRDLIPLTVIDYSCSHFSVPAFESSISNFLTSDDVFQLEFLQSKQELRAPRVLIPC